MKKEVTEKEVPQPFRREIKFRAWDTFNAIMMYADMNRILDGTRPCDFRMSYQEGQASPVMQFTGLHDKNGKEIYEGDALLHDDGSRFLVEWSDGRFIAVRPRKHGDDVRGIWEFGGCIEIIGNIYENPELLAPSRQPREKGEV